ncbi:AIF_collapsed_G0032100.mRNA.1.CDS.1 [Saccharomyces cerevisiae]|nr:AIF_collapsed_G0032100.mRNA.1.CDS.1 [Saccharomyces cerevisiae]
MSESSISSSKPSVELPQATWSHLQRYPALSKFIKYAESLPPVERLISFNLVVLGFRTSGFRIVQLSSSGEASCCCWEGRGLRWTS